MELQLNLGTFELFQMEFYVKSRVDNAAVWSARLARLAPVACAHVETVRFDTQK